MPRLVSGPPSPGQPPGVVCCGGSATSYNRTRPDDSRLSGGRQRRVALRPRRIAEDWRTIADAAGHPKAREGAGPAVAAQRSTIVPSEQPERAAAYPHAAGAVGPGRALYGGFTNVSRTITFRPPDVWRTCAGLAEELRADQPPLPGAGSACTLRYSVASSPLKRSTQGFWSEEAWDSRAVSHQRFNRTTDILSIGA